MVYPRRKGRDDRARRVHRHASRPHNPRHPGTVVFDRLYLRGHLAERTTDWYAQDKRGNVWYLGERTAELDTHGKTTSTEGSWQANVGGARAGIYMPAHPKRGQRRTPGVLQRARRGPVRGPQPRRARGHTGGLIAPRAADPGTHAARARRGRPQALRGRHRHRRRAIDQGRQRAVRGGLDQPEVAG